MEPIFITDKAPEDHGLDYAYLKDEGITWLQDLAGAVWTDYNEEDPGVTILEQLCYALTELSYRCEIPLKDLLTDRASGRIDTFRHALFIPKRILPCNPYTNTDHRKLIFDRITEPAPARGPALGNVWFEKFDANTLGGLYEIRLYIPSWKKKVDRPWLEQKVIKVYNAHRSLCEDCVKVCFLDRVKNSVHADVAIDSATDSASVLATLFFLIQDYFAPQIKRYSLEALLKKGLTPDEIFEGPLPENGFIRSEDLTPQPCVYHDHDVVKLIMGVKGVESVSSLRMDIHQVTPNQLADLDTAYRAEEKSYTIRIFHKGMQCRVNPLMVEKELEKLRKAFSRPYPLEADYERLLGLPKGRYRDVLPYYSIQNQFPLTYGIGSFGLAGTVTEARKGKAKQLKGYLLVFEQLMANFFAQLQQIKDLFSIDRDVRHTYFYQYLNSYVPNVSPLLKNDYKKCLGELVHSQDPFVDRRNRFLDYLLALYGEKIDPDALYTSGACGKRNLDTGRNLIRSKTKLLRHLVTSTQDRGKGFDYLEGLSHKNIAGMLIKIRILLGWRPYSDSFLAHTFKGYDIRWLDEDPEKTSGGNEETLGVVMEKRMDPDPQGRPVRDPSTHEETTLLSKMRRFIERAVDPCFLCHGNEFSHYRIWSDGRDDYTAAFICPSTGNTKIIGRFTHKIDAFKAVSTWVEFIEDLHSLWKRIYVVEHILLLKPYIDKNNGISMQDDWCESGRRPPKKMNAGYTISVFVSLSSCLTVEKRDYKQFVEQTILANTPAHIRAYIHWLKPWQMMLFEILYKCWVRELQKNNESGIKQASRKMKEFIGKQMEKRRRKEEVQGRADETVEETSISINDSDTLKQAMERVQIDP